MKINDDLIQFFFKGKFPVRRSLAVHCAMTLKLIYTELSINHLGLPSLQASEVKPGYWVLN